MAGFRPFVYAKSGQHTFNSIDEALWGVRVHMAIFSKDYAESKFCLEELCDMLRSGKLIFPVYLDVEPRDLKRPHKGAFACAFRKHLRLGRKEDICLRFSEASKAREKGRHLLALFGSI